MLHGVARMIYRQSDNQRTRISHTADRLEHSFFIVGTRELEHDER